MFTNLTMCTDTIPTFLGVFDPSIAPPLLFYSYIPIAIVALLIGVLIIIRDFHSYTARILFVITMLFVLSILNEIMLWVALPAALIYFGWALVPLLRLGLIICTIAFVYAHSQKKVIPFKGNLFLFILSLPVLLFLPTTLNITAFDLDNCEALSGPLITYVYVLSAATIAWIACVGVSNHLKQKKDPSSEHKATLTLTIACGLFLLFLSFSEFVAIHTGDYTINLIGPVGMLMFMGLLSYSIVQFRIFKLNIIGSQVLVITLWFLIGSLLFVAQSNLTKFVAAFTLFASIILGYMLIRSVKQAVRQKEEIEKLAHKLEKANAQLKILDKMKSEFVSIASHQLRSPLTSIRGYSSMLLEGSFGKLPPKAKDAVERIAESSRFMASSVEDYLNVSRIQAGNMKYEYSDFNIKDLAERIADDTRQTAIKKGLLLTFKSDITKRGIVHADIGKTRQIIDNLLNNSLKYTKKGFTEVFVHDKPKEKKIFVDIHDSGIGMSPKTLEDLFGKFERASNANEVNVTGTGLGLFIARKMARDMGGDVVATSEGEGKGATFTLILPLQM